MRASAMGTAHVYARPAAKVTLSRMMPSTPKVITTAKAAGRPDARCARSVSACAFKRGLLPQRSRAFIGHAAVAIRPSQRDVVASAQHTDQRRGSIRAVPRPLHLFVMPHARSSFSSSPFRRLRLEVSLALWPPLHTRPGDELGDSLEPPIVIFVDWIALDYEAQARAWCVEVRWRRRGEEP